MKLSKDVIQIVEDCGFAINIEKQNTGDKLFDSYCANLNQSTPEGEDWWIIIIFDGTDSTFINEVRDTAYYFNVDEEVEVFISRRGEGRCPNSISALVDDARWKEKKLSDLARELNEWENEKFTAKLFGN